MASFSTPFLASNSWHNFHTVSFSMISAFERRKLIQALGRTNILKSGRCRRAYRWATLFFLQIMDFFFLGYNRRLVCYRQVIAGIWCNFISFWKPVSASKTMPDTALINQCWNNPIPCLSSLLTSCLAPIVDASSFRMLLHHSCNQLLPKLDQRSYNYENIEKHRFLTIRKIDTIPVIHFQRTMMA